MFIEFFKKAIKTLGQMSDAVLHTCAATFNQGPSHWTPDTTFLHL